MAGVFCGSRWAIGNAPYAASKGRRRISQPAVSRETRVSLRPARAPETRSDLVVAEPQETEAPFDNFVQFGENYLIEYIRSDAIQPNIHEFLEEAFERDYAYFTGLMEELYWGVEAELEEQAYLSRRSRLADRG